MIKRRTKMIFFLFNACSFMSYRIFPNKRPGGGCICQTRAFIRGEFLYIYIIQKSMKQFIIQYELCVLQVYATHTHLHMHRNHNNHLYRFNNWVFLFSQFWLTSIMIIVFLGIMILLLFEKKNGGGLLEEAFIRKYTVTF